MPAFDKEIRARTWLTTGAAVAGWVGMTVVPGLPAEKQAPYLMGGFIAGALLGIAYDFTALDIKGRKGKGECE